MKLSFASPLAGEPTLEERREIAVALLGLAKELRYGAEVQTVETGYSVVETGDKQLKNAISVLKDGIAFYTPNAALIDLLSQHGLEAKCVPLGLSSSHNRFRYKISHVTLETIEELRPLFLAMIHDSIVYVQNGPNDVKGPACQT